MKRFREMESSAARGASSFHYWYPFIAGWTEAFVEESALPKDTTPWPGIEPSPPDSQSTLTTRPRQPHHFMNTAPDKFSCRSILWNTSYKIPVVIKIPMCILLPHAKMTYIFGWCKKKSTQTHPFVAFIYKLPQRCYLDGPKTR